MSEFDDRKRKVGPGYDKTDEQYQIDAAFVLGANPDHPDGGRKLRELAQSPNPRVRAAAEAQLYPDSDCSDDSDD